MPHELPFAEIREPLESNVIVRKSTGNVPVSKELDNFDLEMLKRLEILESEESQMQPIEAKETDEKVTEEVKDNSNKLLDITKEASTESSRRVTFHSSVSLTEFSAHSPPSRSITSYEENLVTSPPLKESPPRRVLYGTAPDSKPGSFMKDDIVERSPSEEDEELDESDIEDYHFTREVISDYFKYKRRFARGVEDPDEEEPDESGYMVTRPVQIGPGAGDVVEIDSEIRMYVLDQGVKEEIPLMTSELATQPQDRIPQEEIKVSRFMANRLKTRSS